MFFFYFVNCFFNWTSVGLLISFSHRTALTSLTLFQIATLNAISMCNRLTHTTGYLIEKPIWLSRKKNLPGLHSSTTQQSLHRHGNQVSSISGLMIMLSVVDPLRYLPIDLIDCLCILLGLCMNLAHANLISGHELGDSFIKFLTTEAWFHVSVDSSQF